MKVSSFFCHSLAVLRNLTLLPISSAPDLFLHLADSDLVIFKGDLNHRKLTYDCHAPPSTPFDMAIGPLATEPGAPPVLSLRTIKSDVVVGIPPNKAEELDEAEKGWKISGKFRNFRIFRLSRSLTMPLSLAGKYAVVLLSEGRKGEPVNFA